ncbi:MAG: YlaF family protein [Bacillaceae bacterium]|nr:YlaF family protein [Bacillaceae bacterium]
MNRHKWIALFLAIITALLLASIGVFIAEESVIGVIGALLGATMTTGIGFTLKRKQREQDRE